MWVPQILVKFSLHSMMLSKRTQGVEFCSHSTRVCFRASRRSGLPYPWVCLWCYLGLRETLGLISQLLKESLRQYVDRIFTVITKSGVSCPTVMCDIFFSLREAAAKRFQGEPPGPEPRCEDSAVLAHNSPVSGKEPHRV